MTTLIVWRLMEAPLGTSRFARLLESYRLATKQPPPPGLVSRPAQRPDARAREELPRVVGEAGRGDRPVQLRVAARSW
jgi:hypothetical protein